MADAVGIYSGPISARKDVEEGAASQGIQEREEYVGLRTGQVQVWRGAQAGTVVEVVNVATRRAPTHAVEGPVARW